MVIEKNDEMSECGIKIDSEKIEQMKDYKYLGLWMLWMLWIGNFTYGYRNDYYTGYGYGQGHTITSDYPIVSANFGYRY